MRDVTLPTHTANHPLQQHRQTCPEPHGHGPRQKRTTPNPCRGRQLPGQLRGSWGRGGGLQPDRPLCPVPGVHNGHETAVRVLSPVREDAGINLLTWGHSAAPLSHPVASSPHGCPGSPLPSCRPRSPPSPPGALHTWPPALSVSIAPEPYPSAPSKPCAASHSHPLLSLTLKPPQLLGFVLA